MEVQAVDLQQLEGESHVGFSLQTLEVDSVPE